MHPYFWPSHAKSELYMELVNEETFMKNFIRFVFEKCQNMSFLGRSILYSYPTGVTPGGQSLDFFDIVILSPMHRFEGTWFWLKHFLVVFRRRSLGFIAASRVSYGPLPEYKANQGKNYNNTDKMTSPFFVM